MRSKIMTRCCTGLFLASIIIINWRHWIATRTGIQAAVFIRIEVQQWIIRFVYIESRNVELKCSIQFGTQNHYTGSIHTHLHTHIYIQILTVTISSKRIPFFASIKWFFSRHQAAPSKNRPFTKHPISGTHLPIDSFGCAFKIQMKIRNETKRMDINKHTQSYRNQNQNQSG